MHLSGTQIVRVITLAFVAWSALLDSRTRRIPNWLTVSGFLAGILVHGALGGWHAIRVTLEGAGLGLAILMPLVLLRALGAGDWKLMGALGALVGPQMLWFVLVASVLVAGDHGGLSDHTGSASAGDFSQHRAHYHRISHVWGPGASGDFAG